MTSLDTVRSFLAEEHGLAVVSTVQADGAVLSSVVNCGVIPFLGHHPRVTRRGRNVGIVFGPFWALAAVLNVLAFSASLPT